MTVNLGQSEAHLSGRVVTRVAIRARQVDFRRWMPEMGRVFDKAFAFRGKGTPVDRARPWMPTAIAIAAACDGRRGYLISRGDLAEFLAAHEQQTLIVHDAAGELDALDVAVPGLDIYRAVDADGVEDVQILHRLLALATEGHTDPESDRSGLAALVRGRLKADLPGSRLDPAGQPVGRSYARWLNKPFEVVDADDLEALAWEAFAVRLLSWRLRMLIGSHLADSAHRAWGYVSPGWLSSRIHRWGLLTHNIQVKAAVVLRSITARGLHVDLDRHAELMAGLGAILEEQRAILRDFGYLPGQPSSNRAIRSILGRIERRGGCELARLASGEYATSEEALAPLVVTEPFVRAFLAHRAADHLRSTFLDKMGRRVLHPSFDPLKATTGRASSFGELNAHGIPRDPRVRSCFVPAPDHVLVVADFKAIEMVAIGQTLRDQFGLESDLAVALNAGKDPHVMVAALATGKDEADVTPDERGKAKPVNFGLPGAMSPSGLQAYARVGYGVELDESEVAALTGAWFDLFPEMREFLRNEADLGLEVAGTFGLTPASYLEHTGSRRFHDRGDALSAGDEPSPILGGMFLKAVRSSDPATRSGRPYESIELDYFWSRALACSGLFRGGDRDAVMARRPSPRLQRAVMSLVDAAPVFTLTGRLRANASFPARHNTIFQGLAADGSKLALWKVWRAGFAISNFIHDELVVEVPDGPDVARDVREIRRLMIEGMREVIPDVRVDVECFVSSSWSEEDGVPMATDGRPAPRTGPLETVA